MKKILLIIPFCVFFLIILSFMYLLIKNRNPSEIPSALIKKEVPVFETSSLIKDKDFISKNEFGNQIILVNFFASWCEPCRIEHFYINKLSKKGIKVIGINYKDEPKQAIKWLEKLGNPYAKIALDFEGDIAINWGVYGIPETFIINKESIIQYRHAGPITKSEYDDFYKRVLKIKKND